MSVDEPERRQSTPVPAGPVYPTLDDPLLRPATEALGGPIGAHADLPGRTWWNPTRVVLLVLFGSLVVAYLAKLPCRDTARWVNQYQFTHVCYTDVAISWSTYGLDSGSIPYLTVAIPYPPLTGALMQIAVVLAGLWPSGPSAAAYIDASVLLLAVCAVVVVVTTAVLAGRRRPWDALMVALSPVLILHAFTNWDLLAAALLGIALVLWSRQAPVWAGMALGLATAAKLWPLIALLALAMLCWRAGRVRAWATCAVVTVMTWAAVSIPLLLAAPETSILFWRENITRGPDWDSLWLPVSDALGTGVVPGWVFNALMSLSVVAISIAVWWLVARADRRPRLPQVLFVLLALFLIVGKVFSPQDALWLTPLAVLARPRWRMFLVWQATEVVLTVNRMLLLVGLEEPSRGLPRGWWYVTVGLRDAALLALVAFVVREMLQPHRDVVRTDGVDDPAGGVLDGAPDGGVSGDARELTMSAESR